MFGRYEKIEDIYPLMIVMDRYCGTYSGGEYTAWNKYHDQIPEEIAGDDISCWRFWENYKGIVGRGATIEEAANDLLRQLRDKKRGN